jgi:hypothetical protein
MIVWDGIMVVNSSELSLFDSVCVDSVCNSKQIMLHPMCSPFLHSRFFPTDTLYYVTRTVVRSCSFDLVISVVVFLVYFS